MSVTAAAGGNFGKQQQSNKPHPRQKEAEAVVKTLTEILLPISNAFLEKSSQFENLTSSTDSSKSIQEKMSLMVVNQPFHELTQTDQGTARVCMAVLDKWVKDHLVLDYKKSLVSIFNKKKKEAATSSSSSSSSGVTYLRDVVRLFTIFTKVARCASLAFSGIEETPLDSKRDIPISPPRESFISCFREEIYEKSEFRSELDNIFFSQIDEIRSSGYLDDRLLAELRRYADMLMKIARSVRVGVEAVAGLESFDNYYHDSIVNPYAKQMITTCNRLLEGHRTRAGKSSSSTSSNNTNENNNNNDNNNYMSSSSGLSTSTSFSASAASFSAFDTEKPGSFAIWLIGRVEFERTLMATVVLHGEMTPLIEYAMVQSVVYPVLKDLILEQQSGFLPSVKAAEKTLASFRPVICFYQLASLDRGFTTQQLAFASGSSSTSSSSSSSSTSSGNNNSSNNKNKTDFYHKYNANNVNIHEAGESLRLLCNNDLSVGILSRVTEILKRFETQEFAGASSHASGVMGALLDEIRVTEEVQAAIRGQHAVDAGLKKAFKRGFDNALNKSVASGGSMSGSPTFSGGGGSATFSPSVSSSSSSSPATAASGGGGANNNNNEEESVWNGEPIPRRFQKKPKTVWITFAEVLAAFSDSYLRDLEVAKTAASKIISAGARRDEKKEFECLGRCFSFIQDRDVFSEHYKLHLARRLLEFAYSDDRERSLLAQLEKHSDHLFIYSMEAMLNELQTGRQIADEFQQFKESGGVSSSSSVSSSPVKRNFFDPIPQSISSSATSAASGGGGETSGNNATTTTIDFVPMVIKKNSWPQRQTLSEFRWPAQIQLLCLNKFKDWWMSKSRLSSKRDLEWQPERSPITIAVRLPKGVKEFTMNALQAAVLLSVDELAPQKPAGHGVSIGDIANDVGLTVEDTKAMLATMLFTQFPVLRRVGVDDQRVSLAPEHRVGINSLLRTPIKKIPLPFVLATSSGVNEFDPAKIEIGRRTAIELALIRTCKARKQIKQQELLLVVSECLQKHFKAHPRSIKHCLEELCSREFLQRNEDDPSIIEFLSTSAG